MTIAGTLYILFGLAVVAGVIWSIFNPPASLEDEDPSWP